MERKRKLPPRAAARLEQAAKRRQTTPREPSSTPAPPEPVREPTPPPPPPPPLPTFIQVGQPLPTVDDPQPLDLSAKDFQSLSESGVLTESLSRSRHKWINEGLFEKYWTKPYKRKGVVHQDPNNPPKDSMTKVGIVTITIEPHIVEATMFAVKAPKLPPQDQSPSSAQKQSPSPATASKPQKQKQPKQPQLARPVLQYGPPNGSMPPPPTPQTPAAVSPAVASPVSVPLSAPAPAPPKPIASPSPAPQRALQSPSPTPQGRSPAQAAAPRPISVQPGAQRPVLSPSPGAPPRPSPAPAPLPPTAISHNPGTRPPSNPAPRQAVAPPPAAHQPLQPGNRPPGTLAPAAPPAGVVGAKPAPVKPAANDPVIALLAQKASVDPELRDLMKRVAAGQAKEGELAKFQKIIDQLNAEYKSKGGQQGPSADRLLVDGRTVKYFADEVRTILDIVLASNPNQKSSELRPPPRSDALVVLLVKTALEDQRTKDMIRRIAEGRPGFTDAQDLKEILDRLHRDAKTVPKAPPPTPPPSKQPTPNGVHNGHGKPATPSAVQQANPQALRSKGPPPAARPDISAVVFDFGTGDRYLFPKFSILEFLPSSSGQQVVASFLIVRKGSISDYGGDPTLDFYQPVTMRIQTSSGRHLENLARVVAPQDEVRRYMDDVMDNMTRAEYVLLAMRLPRAEPDDDEDGLAVVEEPRTGVSTPKSETESEPARPARLGVLWTTNTNKPPDSSGTIKFRDPEQEAQSKYERLIRSVAAKETEPM
ncbi:hypothetical protein JDV02_009013 [Purpureocillium takamizusanense]|uniref:SWR1-complex protein 3 domain-containing protein n=1 Tax=Purpureocillium takamizusanense TaxID=2060973 RepID=A0A9Q8VF14_9HYPO|nr:uncharacterized protein JDV02_009013 [Purpureocillium takamizusanense]UNI23178.1 hypothetical protein JDV02_009013 [Purpureocillium takamizusanense]